MVPRRSNQSKPVIAFGRDFSESVGLASLLNDWAWAYCFVLFAETKVGFSGWECFSSCQ